jgi:hypothetical protein
MIQLTVLVKRINEQTYRALLMLDMRCRTAQRGENCGKGGWRKAEGSKHRILCQVQPTGPQGDFVLSRQLAIPTSQGRLLHRWTFKSSGPWFRG